MPWLLYHTYIKINSKWIISLHVNKKTIKVSEKENGRISLQCWHSHGYLRTLKKERKGKSNKKPDVVNLWATYSTLRYLPKSNKNRPTKSIVKECS